MGKTTATRLTMMGFGLYLAVIVTARAVLPRHPALWESTPFVVVATALALMWLILPGVVIRRRLDDIERHVLVESTSIAFFVTMAAALTLALCQAFAGVPRVSAWWTWAVGMFTWAAVGLYQSRVTR